MIRNDQAAGILVDAGGSKRFLVLSSHSFVQDAFRNNAQEMNLLALAAQGYNTKYPTENDWLGGENLWYTL